MMGRKKHEIFSCSNYSKETQEQNNYAEEYIGVVDKGQTATSIPHHIFFHIGRSKELPTSIRSMPNTNWR